MTSRVHRAERVSRITRARRTSRCPVCCDDVSPGDQISLTPRGWAHARCTGRIVTLTVKGGLL